MRPLAPALIVALAMLLGLPAHGKAPRTYTIKAGDTPAGVAKRFKVPLDELLRFNSLEPGGSFVVGRKLEIPKPGQVTGSTYVVRPGDSIAKVADFHGVSQFDLRRANRMGPKGKLKIGQEITIPMILRGGASQGHVIRKGDTLASIAARYDVSVGALAKENKLERGSVLDLGRTLIIPDEDDEPEAHEPRRSLKLVKSGEKIPGGVRHTVQPGQTLWSIARAYNVKGQTIARRNELEEGAALKAWQKLVIPGAKKVVPVRVKGFVVQPIRFVRVYNDESMSLKLMNRSGRVNKWSRKKLSALAGPRKGKRRAKLFHPRLIHMIQRVAEHWPGKTIEIVSGYRPGETGSESKHSEGRAIDFRVAGVSNKDLYDFCTQLPKSGCGYYPNSVFIHMDARDKSATWTDVSAPGEKAQYVK